MGKMFFNILATFAEFEVDLLRLRTKEGTAIARARGRLKGRRPKLPARQQPELCQIHGTGEDTIAELIEVLSVDRARCTASWDAISTAVPRQPTAAPHSPEPPARTQQGEHER
jgi:DNA invertase Pin-like site-specific DNA recombinase